MIRLSACSLCLCLLGPVACCAAGEEAPPGLLKAGAKLSLNWNGTVVTQAFVSSPKRSLNTAGSALNLQHLQLTAPKIRRVAPAAVAAEANVLTAFPANSLRTLTIGSAKALGGINAIEIKGLSSASLTRTPMIKPLRELVSVNPLSLPLAGH